MVDALAQVRKPLLTPEFDQVVASDLDKAIRGVQQEYTRLDDAWRHLMHFPVLAAYLLHTARSPDPALAQWYQTTLPQYSKWTWWEAPAASD